MQYTILKTLINIKKPQPCWSFAYDSTRVDIVQDTSGHPYLKVLHRFCDAEANGRPVSTIEEVCYPIPSAKAANADNWQDLRRAARSKAITLRRESVEGVLRLTD